MGRALIAWRATTTNLALAEAWGCPILTPPEAGCLRTGDVALARLDVRPTLDGIEEGVEALGTLAARGITVVNGPSLLLATHDKLLTARLLAGAGVPHPATRLVPRSTRAARRALPAPVVVKPRFGTGGRHVVRCDSDESATRHVDTIRHERWFLSGGAVEQELIEPRGFDLRVVVASGRVVGAVVRVAALGEWRTNVGLGATRVAVDPPVAAQEVALAAAAAVGAGLVGVDLLPVGDDRWVVIEINGAVEFTTDYALGADVFAAVIDALDGRSDRSDRPARPRAVPA